MGIPDSKINECFVVLHAVLRQVEGHTEKTTYARVCHDVWAKRMRMPFGSFEYSAQKQLDADT